MSITEHQDTCLVMLVNGHGQQRPRAPLPILCAGVVGTTPAASPPLQVDPLKEAAALQACTAELSQYGVALMEVQEHEQQDQLGRGGHSRGQLGANRPAAVHSRRRPCLDSRQWVSAAPSEVAIQGQPCGPKAPPEQSALKRALTRACTHDL